MNFFNMMNEALHTRRYEGESWDTPEYWSGSDDVPAEVKSELAKNLHDLIDKKIVKIRTYNSLEIICTELTDEIENLFDEAAETEEEYDDEDDDDDEEDD